MLLASTLMGKGTTVVQASTPYKEVAVGTGGSKCCSMGNVHSCTGRYLDTEEAV